MRIEATRVLLCSLSDRIALGAFAMGSVSSAWRRVVIGFAVASTVAGGAVALTPAAAAGGSPKPAPVASAPLLPADFAPAAAGVQMLRQPDGHLIRARLTAATQGGLFETVPGGYSISRGAGGYYRYVLGRNANGSLRLSSAVVGRDHLPAGLTPHAGRQHTKVSRAEQEIRDSIQRQLQVASYQAQLKAAATGKPRVYRVPALLFATWWDADKGQTSPQFQKGHGLKYFKKLLSGFGGNPRGSVTQFYWESSFGQFLVKIDVYGPFVSNRSRDDRCYYGDIGEPQPPTDLDPLGTAVQAGGGGALGMALEVLPEADPAVNFAKYDNNGDGKVDFTIIIHSGGDMAVTGDPCNTWSHALQATLGEGQAVEQQLGLPPGTLARAGIATSDGVTVDRVLTIPEFESAADPLTIGVASHEMAHSLGEPDYYDTTYNSTGTGDFDIMAGGSYLGNPSGSDPALQNPATRVFQGWLKPRIVHHSLRHVRLKPRSVFPSKHYSVKQTDHNLLLIPTYEVKLGGTDKVGHTWTQFDVTGLAKDPKTHKYVVEGYYVENVARMAHARPEHKGETRGALFDRKQHSSGLMVWHFDYWKRSNTLYGGNDAQTDPDRYQMDVEEFDQNDNTQDLQLNFTRGNPADFLQGAATGITSGTRALPPGDHPATGDPQDPVDLGGTTPPAASSSQQFTVDKNPNNAVMEVAVGSTNPAGDCTLTLTDPKGKDTPTTDAAGAGEQETYTVARPMAGKWTVTVGDFAGCLQWAGTARFTGPGSYTTQGAADTWSNWSRKPSGWAFTNVGPRKYDDGLDERQDTSRSSTISLDVLNLKRRADVSPGFVTGAHNHHDGTGSISAGQRNRMTVPVFSNGSKAPGRVVVKIRNGSAHGRLVAKRHVTLAGYQRKNVRFHFRPSHVGAYHLYTSVRRTHRRADADKGNNTQMTEGWAGPRVAHSTKHSRVLVVDDDGLLTQERAVTGALASLGVRYAVVKDHPLYSTMRRYGAVVWESGTDRYVGQLDAKDQAVVTKYLDRGGRVLFTSNRLIDAMGIGQTASTPQSTTSQVNFGAHYLGTVLPNSSYTATQEEPVSVRGHGLLKGVKGRIAPEMIRPFVDFGALSSKSQTGIGTTERPYGKASGVLTAKRKDFPAVRPTAKPWLGAAVNGDAKHHHFKTITLGYNLGQDTNASTTVRIVRAAMRHFHVRLHRARSQSRPVVYDVAVRDQVSGRATPITAIVLGRHHGPVTLHYRTHGRAAYRTKRMHARGPRGVYTARIPGRIVTPSGVNYYIQAGRGRHRSFAPALASSHKLAYAIGVQLPEVRH
jgi:M6 family metalloprotease-like protein